MSKDHKFVSENIEIPGMDARFQIAFKSLDIVLWVIL
jgi:hypothetical protein